VTVIAEPLECNLPDLPGPFANAVGYPSPDGQTIYVSISDFAALGGYLLAMRLWIDSASGCLTGAQ